MLTAGATGILVLVFILTMVWLRTRLRYPHAAGTCLRLTRAGAGYFAVLGALLWAGWLGAPQLAQQLNVSELLSPAFARAAWFLAVYLAFIPLHGLLMARGIRVFRIAERAASAGPL